MINIFIQFLYMGGYGFYVWTAYGCVLGLLGIQGLNAWRKWRQYLHTQQNTHE